MPRVTVSELAVQIEDLIGPVTPTDTVFGYTHIFRHLSAAQRKIRNIVAILKPELLLARADLTITAGTATCEMPANSGGIMLITETNSDGTSAMPINHIEHVGNYVNVAEEDSLEDMMRALEWSSSNGWIEYGNNQIRLFPTPSTSALVLVSITLRNPVSSHILSFGSNKMNRAGKARIKRTDYPHQLKRILLVFYLCAHQCLLHRTRLPLTVFRRSVPGGRDNKLIVLYSFFLYTHPVP